MIIYYCRDRFEDMLTCIYDAWCAGIKEGHENIRLQKEGFGQQVLFAEYRYVEYDPEKTEKVIRSIQQKISWEAYTGVYYGCMSGEEDALQTVYEFLRLGFKVGSRVTQMMTEACVLRMMELRKRVGGEAHSFIEFARFTAVGSGVYLSHIEPRENVVLLVAEHFADRMPSENWMIVDDTRRMAVVHPRDGEYCVRNLTEEEFVTLCRAYRQEDLYTDLWKSFFRAVSIQERENPVCQRNLFPKWKRKNAVEFF